MPAMPPMPAMPVGMPSLEQIEAKMRDAKMLDAPMSADLLLQQEQMAVPEPPQKFWGDLPDSQGVSMADIMNEEKEKAKQEMKVAKPKMVFHPRVQDPSPEPQPDLMTSGKFDWTTKSQEPSQGVATQSLAEIQAEEERKRSLVKASRVAQGTSNNSWAAKLGGNNVYPGPDSSYADLGASATAVAADKPAAHLPQVKMATVVGGGGSASAGDADDGFEAVTSRRKKHGKSRGSESGVGRSATTTIQREVRVAAPAPNTKTLASIQAEEMERRKLAANAPNVALAPQSEDDMFWEMPSAPQPQQPARYDSSPHLGLGNPWNTKQQQSAPSPGSGNASFPSLSSQPPPSGTTKANPMSTRGSAGGARKAEKQSAAVSSPLAGQMSSEFAKWCKEQMFLLNGSDDMTLVEFLMTLGSEKDIREYVEFYLGKGPQISKFTTEFLFRFEEETKASSGGPEGGPTGAKGSGNRKKGKKKGKKLDASLLGFNTGIHLYTDLEVE